MRPDQQQRVIDAIASALMPVQIADSARVSLLADLEKRPGALIVVEEGAVIDSFVKIRPTIGEGDVVIGARSQLNSGVMIYTGYGVRLGKDVLVAAGVIFAPVNHQYRDRVRIRDQGFAPSRGGIVVEDDVWIGAGSVLLDGAVIRHGAVIGAMSLVRGEVPEWAVAVGNPLTVIGTRRRSVG